MSKHIKDIQTNDYEKGFLRGMETAYHLVWHEAFNPFHQEHTKAGLKNLADKIQTRGHLGSEYKESCEHWPLQESG